MLNNDFKVLVEKYYRYKKQKKKARNRRILLFILVGIIAYFLLTQDFSAPPKVSQKEHNTTTVHIEKNSTSDINHSSKVPQKNEENISKIATPKQPKVKKVTKPKVNQLHLQVTTQKETLAQLLKNQEKSKSYSATIALANYHYSKKEYDEAIRWAIEASKKNKSKARPWIIYAKSKKAQGKIEIAKKALTLFLKRHKNEEAETLLNSL